MMDDEGEGAAGPPDGGEHTDEPEDNQDIPHAADAGPQHEGNVTRRVPLPQGVPGETGEPEQERPQDAGPGEDAHGEAAQKDAEDNGFHIRFLGIRMDEKDVIPRHAALVNPGRTARRRRLTALPAHRAAPPLMMGGFIDEASA